MFTNLDPAVQGAVAGSAGAVCAAIIGAIGAWMTTRSESLSNQPESF